jgi:very-short-patch-repair endonuclease
LLNNRNTISIYTVTRFGKEDYDEARQNKLENLGIRFLRFEYIEIVYYLDEVLKKIDNWINQNY